MISYKMFDFMFTSVLNSTFFVFLFQKVYDYPPKTYFLQFLKNPMNCSQKMAFAMQQIFMAIMQHRFHSFV